MQKVKPNKADESILVICTGMLILYCASGNRFLLYLCIGIGILSLFSKKAAFGIHWLWMQLAWVLSLIFPPIFMSLFFFLFLTPIALLSRVFGKKNDLKLKRPTANSLFVDRNKTFEVTDFEKVW
jgi:hypothetical protein